MTRNKLVVTIVTIFIVYTLLTGFLGDKGYFVNKRLKQILPNLQDELEEMVIENKRLTDLKIMYEADYQKILEEAYRYGYLQENEFRIIINAFTSYDNGLVSSSNLGKRIIMPKGMLTQKQIILISLLSGIIVFISFYVYAIIKKHNSID